MECRPWCPFVDVSFETPYEVGSSLVQVTIVGFSPSSPAYCRQGTKFRNRFFLRQQLQRGLHILVPPASEIIRRRTRVGRVIGWHSKVKFWLFWFSPGQLFGSRDSQTHFGKKNTRHRGKVGLPVAGESPDSTLLFHRSLSCDHAKSYHTKNTQTQSRVSSY